MGTAGSEQRVFPFIASTSEKQFEHGGALNGTLVTEASTTYSYGDGYGNPTQVQTTTWDRDPYSPYLNSAWRSTINLGYANDVSGNWCLGLPVSHSTTSAAPEQVAVTQTTTYATDPVACRITQQVVEPNIPGTESHHVVRLRRLRQSQLRPHCRLASERHGDAGPNCELRLRQSLPAARIRHQCGRGDDDVRMALRLRGGDAQYRPERTVHVVVARRIRTPDQRDGNGWHAPVLDVPVVRHDRLLAWRASLRRLRTANTRRTVR